MILKRLFDVLFSLIGLVLLSPLLILVAILVKLDSSGPAMFRQERVGLNGRLFKIHKYRTMVVNAEKLALQITVGDDARITKVGRIIRKYKIDEFPQLIDVFLGDMSMVGPRPEVAKYVAHYPEISRELVLSVRPGITDRASIEYKDENTILGQTNDPESAYIKQVLPVKLRFYEAYVNNRSFLGDLGILWDTFVAVFFSRIKN